MKKIIKLKDAANRPVWLYQGKSIWRAENGFIEIRDNFIGRSLPQNLPKLIDDFRGSIQDGINYIRNNL